MAEILEVEFDVIGGSFRNHVLKDLTDAKDSDVDFLMHILEKLKLGDYLAVLTDARLQNIICKLSHDNWKTQVQSNLAEYSNGSAVNQLIVLLTGVASLQLFVSKNWTGPIKQSVNIFPSLSSYFSSNEEMEKWVKFNLSANDESVYNLIRCPETLLFAEIILQDLQEQLKDCITSKWWLLRCLRVHQLTMMERNPIIHSKIFKLVDEIQNSDSLKQHWQLHVQFCVEVSLIYIYYHEVTKAKQLLLLAQDIIGLDVQLSSALGKRTYYQQNALPQLLLKVKRSDKIADIFLPNESLISDSFLKNITLKDDTILNEIKFLNEEDNEVDTLYPEEQVIILALSSLAKKYFSIDPLMHEELMTYFDFLLKQTKVWCIQIQSLMHRCQLEKTNSRRVERAMMQMQELVDCTLKEDAPVIARLYLFYCTQIPPYWMMEKELADIFLSLGVNQSALEIFLRLELWEDVVYCYKRLQRRQRAEALIRHLLETEETPLLWCLLGDATDDESCYLKAWELSSHRNSRAQKSLGNLYFQRKQYKECIPYFQKSLELNHLQLEVWFSLAYAATKTEEYELAAKSYRTVVGLDNDNFEAWNNLSNAYIKMKQKERAWKTLQEALKCNYEDWRIWENYLLVCIDIGAFEDVIKAWHRLIDIKGKHMDEEVLSILIKAILEDMPDIYGHPASKLRKNALTLLGRITSKVTNNSKAWQLYAKLCLNPEGDNNQETMERALQYLQKAYRSAIQKQNWQKNPSSCKEVLYHAKELTEAYLHCQKSCSNENLTKQLLSSASLMIKSVQAAASKEVEYFPHEECNEITTLLSSLNEYSSEINSKLL
ncbi:tetratricopeptide repeat protein 27 [Centruroides vittatus]|uniref:tetratricopeptide repeat protein 27 n=1 Tax=Centruroides vittatus TaxID=120091 RepID=UPI00350F2A71